MSEKGKSDMANYDDCLGGPCGATVDANCEIVPATQGGFLVVCGKCMATTARLDRKERDAALAERDEADRNASELEAELEEARNQRDMLAPACVEAEAQRDAALASAKSAAEEAGRLREALIAVKSDMIEALECLMTGNDWSVDVRTALARIDSALKEPRHG